MSRTELGSEELVTTDWLSPNRTDRLEISTPTYQRVVDVNSLLHGNVCNNKLGAVGCHFHGYLMLAVPVNGSSVTKYTTTDNVLPVILS